MLHYRYLIVGGGMAAASAVTGIREVDADGTIGMITDEKDPPYDRPPLSKGLWKGQAESEIWRDLSHSATEVHSGRRVAKLDLMGKVATDDQGAEYGFSKLLLATGGSPRRLPFGEEDVIYFRTVEDYRRLRHLSNSGSRFVVIGGGFIGSEVAAALAMQGKKVTLLFPEDAIGARVYPPALASYLNGYYEQRGVRLVPGQTVAAVSRHGDLKVVRTTSGAEIVADGVVAGLGIIPNVELARNAGLEVGAGILVDEQLRTGNPDVFAAGDVAEFYSSALGRRIRVEHEDNANTMGRLAGRGMAGAGEPYRHLPFFYSDLFDLGYEAVGTLDSRLEMVEDWIEPNKEGVVYYVSEGRVRGALLWNVWDRVEAARELIAAPGPFTREDLRGRITPSPSEAAA